MCILRHSEFERILIEVSIQVCNTPFSIKLHMSLFLVNITRQETFLTRNVCSKQNKVHPNYICFLSNHNVYLFIFFFYLSIVSALPFHLQRICLPFSTYLSSKPSSTCLLHLLALSISLYSKPSSTSLLNLLDLHNICIYLPNHFLPVCYITISLSLSSYCRPITYMSVYQPTA